MKFSGKIGFQVTSNSETAPGVRKPIIEERSYTGDVLSNYKSNQFSEYQNDNLVCNSKISILADMYIKQNYQTIKYVLWNGTRWRVTRIDVSAYPKVYIELGGVYNVRA